MIILGDVILCFLTSILFFGLGFLFLSKYRMKKIKFLNDFKESFNQIENKIVRKKVMNAFGSLSILFGCVITFMPFATLYLNDIFYHLSFVILTLSTIIFVIYIKMLNKKTFV